MNRRRLSFLISVGLVLLSFGLAACSGSAASVKPTPSRGAAAIQDATIIFDGRERTYRVFRPPSLASAVRVPLVVVLHGATIDGPTVERISHFDEQAKTARFIVLYPDGISSTWNAGACCGLARVQGIDDVKFIGQLIDRLEGALPIDPSRVFVVGLSNGAMMAYRLACELAQSITAIVSVSGTMGVANCHPARPVSILEIHGTADLVVPYAGGTVDVRPTLPDVFTIASSAAVIQQWVTIDGCTGQPLLGSSGITKTSIWRNCLNGAAVALDSVDGGYHTYFGSPEDDAGYGTTPDATQVAWNFFTSVSAH